jgi:hypothetical protein
MACDQTRNRSQGRFVITNQAENTLASARLMLVANCKTERDSELPWMRFQAQFFHSPPVSRLYMSHSLSGALRMRF